MVEQRFDLSSLNPPEPMFGTSDACVWHSKTKELDILDYKHGQGVAVDAFENEQIMYYAIGGVVALGKRPKKIRVWIVQPRAHHPDGPIRMFEFTWADLVAFKKTLFAAARRTQEPDAPLAVGDWCKFCKALPICPEQRKHALAVAQSEFDVVAPEPKLPSPDLLSDDQLRAIMERAGLVEDWFKAIRMYVYDRLNRGETFEGYKLVAKRANRKWRNPDDALAKLTEVLGDDAYEKKIRSPAQAEKALKAVGMKLDDTLVIKESSGANMAPDTDPRPSLSASAADDFDIPS